MIATVFVRPPVDFSFDRAITDRVESFRVAVFGFTQASSFFLATRIPSFNELQTVPIRVGLPVSTANSSQQLRQDTDAKSIHTPVNSERQTTHGIAPE